MPSFRKPNTLQIAQRENDVDQSDTHLDASLRFDNESARQAGRTRYWRWIAALSVAGACGIAVLTLTFNLLYRVSLHRLAYWPAPLTQRSFDFQEPDPVIQAFSETPFCESVLKSAKLLDIACDIKHRLAFGDFPDPAAKSGEGLEVIGLVLAQTEDAVVRRDWATCARFSKFGAAVLDHREEDEPVATPEHNELLLYAALCENPKEPLRHQRLFSLLANRILTGQHLEANFLDELREPSATIPTLMAWQHYLRGLVLLRAKEFVQAHEAFSQANQHASGLLKELSLLGDARATYWQWRLADAHALRPEAAAARLHAVEALITRTSFKSDVQFYLRTIAK